MNPEQPIQPDNNEEENAADLVYQKLQELHDMMKDSVDIKDEALDEMRVLIRRLENTFGEYKETQEKLAELKEELESATADDQQRELRTQISDLYRQSRDLKKECTLLHKELEENEALQDELREEVEDIRSRFKLLDSFSPRRLPSNN